MSSFEYRDLVSTGEDIILAHPQGTWIYPIKCAYTVPTVVYNVGDREFDDPLDQTGLTVTRLKQHVQAILRLPSLQAIEQGIVV